MNTTEFYNEFDVLYNQVNSNQAPGLDGYEKSVFLTRGQDDELRAYFTMRGNKYMQGMDEAPDKQYDFSTLIENRDVQVRSRNQLPSGSDTMDTRSLWATMDDDIFLVLNESVYKTQNGKDPKILQVKPISYYDYQRLMQKPFKFPPKNTVWRRFFDSETNYDANGKAYVQTRVELISALLDTDFNYKCSFIRRPNPIILTDLTGTDLSINGRKTVTECELPEVMHGNVLQRAVELATATYNP